MIAVTMGCETKKGRAAETSRLLSMGFTQFKALSLLERGAAAASSVPVKGGVVDKVTPVAARELNVVVKSGEQKRISKQVSLCAELQAPVVPGTKCGEIKFMLEDRELGRVDYVVRDDIPKARLRDRVLKIFR